MSSSVVCHRLPLVCRRPVQLSFQAFCQRPSSLVTPWKILRAGGGGGFSCYSAASPSLGGFPSEQLLGAQTQKKKKIAGIDQDELEDPEFLAYPDSCFCEFKGVKIHYKTCDTELDEQISLLDGTTNFPNQTKKAGYPMILLHGFGASTFSWNPVMKSLAECTGSKVLAFDRPAFGLTSRVDPLKHSSSGNEDSKPLNPYSMAFSVLATLYFIDFLSAKKVILVGHSAGSLVAVDSYFQAPERIAAMILVAPAIVAPPFSQMVPEENKRTQDISNSDNGNPIIKFFWILAKFFRYIAQAVMRVAKGIVTMLNFLYKKALSAFLRSSIAVMLVRIVIDKFGITGIRSAWYDAKRITDSVVDGYTRPLRMKGWDRALLEYTAAMIADFEPESMLPLTKRLKEIKCPVLIITGDSDRLVPSWNSEKLSRAIPGSRFNLIKNCGHLPQEEKPEEFVSVVKLFLQSIFGNLESQSLQVAT